MIQIQADKDPIINLTGDIAHVIKEVPEEDLIELDYDSGANINLDSNEYDLDCSVSIETGPPAPKTNDYNNLINKPSINNVILQGNIKLSDLNLAAIYCNTTSNWNKNPSLISEYGAIYIYSDFQMIQGNILIPGLKIGDGNAYLIDLPFITDALAQNILSIIQMLNAHINNPDVHITPEERIFWNNKVTSKMDTYDSENLILTKL